MVVIEEIIIVGIIIILYVIMADINQNENGVINETKRSARLCDDITLHTLSEKNLRQTFYSINFVSNTIFWINQC